jgi:hypothetical protein
MYRESLMRNALMVFAALWLGCGEARAQEAAIRVTVPAHTEWCARSQPVDIAKQSDPDFGALVFQLLYARIEKAALQADLKAIGVPYLAATADVTTPAAATTPAPVSAATAMPPAATGASPGAATSPAPAAGAPSDQPPVMKTFTVCAVVPPGAPAPASGVVARMIAAGDLFSMRCEAKFDEDCKGKIVEAMSKAQIDVSKLTDDSWSIRQATSTGHDAAALVADLSDHTLRTLEQGSALAAPPQLITIAAAVP